VFSGRSNFAADLPTFVSIILGFLLDVNKRINANDFVPGQDGSHVAFWKCHQNPDRSSWLSLEPLSCGPEIPAFIGGEVWTRTRVWTSTRLPLGGKGHAVVKPRVRNLPSITYSGKRQTCAS